MLVKIVGERDAQGDSGNASQAWRQYRDIQLELGVKDKVIDKAR
jgi:hypothetical protein